MLLLPLSQLFADGTLRRNQFVTSPSPQSSPTGGNGNLQRDDEWYSSIRGSSELEPRFIKEVALIG
jgi:hypothetical protein